MPPVLLLTAMPIAEILQLWRAHGAAAQQHAAVLFVHCTNHGDHDEARTAPRDLRPVEAHLHRHHRVARQVEDAGLAQVPRDARGECAVLEEV